MALTDEQVDDLAADEAGAAVTRTFMGNLPLWRCYLINAQDTIKENQNISADYTDYADYGRQAGSCHYDWICVNLRNLWMDPLFRFCQTGNSV